jgi:DNA modification methylase
VLDPFMGSGRTLQVARDLQRDAIGIDLSHKYVLMAREELRLNEQLPM